MGAGRGWRWRAPSSEAPETPEGRDTPRTGSDVVPGARSRPPPGRGGEAHFLVVGHGWEFGGGRLVIMEDLEMANLLLVL